MSRQVVVASVLAMMAAAPVAAPTSPGGVEALAWMQGAWAGEKDGVFTAT